MHAPLACPFTYPCLYLPVGLPQVGDTTLMTINDLNTSALAAIGEDTEGEAQGACLWDAIPTSAPGQAHRHTLRMESPWSVPTASSQPAGLRSLLCFLRLVCAQAARA